MAEKINKENLDEKLESTGIVVVDFYAEWCGPCKVLGPILDKVSEEVDEEGEVAVTKMNVDENSETAVKYGIRTIPTIVFFKDGEEVKRLNGLQTKEKLVSEIEALK